MRESLPESLKLMFGSEGGYVNRATDRGGPTKFGITLKTLAAHRGRTVTAKDVVNLTLSEAETIYRKSYWTQSGSDLLPVGLDYAAFDFGVNSGPATAVKKLQKVLGVTQDGIVGAQTLNAVNKYPGGLEKLIKDYADERMRYLRSIGGPQGWGPNGRGWTIRVTGKDPKGQWKDEPGVVGNALRMAASSPTKVTNNPVVQDAPKADPADLSLTSIAKKPEVWGPLGGLVASIGGVASGNGPVQWALAAVLLAGVAFGIYTFIERQRKTA